jgi:hypothetical protein
MPKTSEIPELVGEFVDMSKDYLREQTLEPAKALGRLAGFSFAGALVLVLAALFLSIAAMRLIIEALPDGPMWSGLGYVVSSFAVLILTGVIMWRVTR